MAITGRGQLKAWFNAKRYPTAAQFWAWLDSFWHKGERLPFSAVENLDTVINRQNEKISALECGATPQTLYQVPEIELTTGNGKLRYKLASQYVGADLENCTLELGVYKRYYRRRTLASGFHKIYKGRKYVNLAGGADWTDVNIIPPALDMSAKDISLGREYEYPYAAEDIAKRLLYFVNPDGSQTTFAELYDAGASAEEIEYAMRVPGKRKADDNTFKVYTDQEGRVKLHYTILCQLYVSRKVEAELIEGYTAKLEMHGTPVRFRVKVWNQGANLLSTIKLAPISVQNAY